MVLAAGDLFATRAMFQVNAKVVATPNTIEEAPPFGHPVDNSQR
jgi:hypothetical protein